MIGENTERDLNLFLNYETDNQLGENNWLSVNIRPSIENIFFT